MNNFAFSLGIIFIGLALGYTIQVLVRRRTIHLPLEMESSRQALQKLAILFLDPIITIGAIWNIELNDLHMLALPFIGLFALLLGGVLALLFARLLKMSRKQTGTYIVSGSFTNIGAIGGLICFTFLGETGFALVAFYKLFEIFAYYTLGFPIAKSYSDDVAEGENFRVRLKKVFLDPFVLVSTGSMLLGLILNLGGIERPGFYAGINSILIPAASILLLSSIGMALRFGQARKYLKEGALIALIKFAIVPLSVTAVSCFLGFGMIDRGLPLKVVLILSSMPVGFTAMVPPTIYNLDLDLANACWIVTNLSLLLIVPLLQYLIALL